MGVIGSFGPYITFEVSDEKIFTFSNMKREVSARWNTHNGILCEKTSEFEGPDLTSMTFDIKMSAAHAINPRVMLEALEYEIKAGEVEMLVIGGKMVGSGYYKITKMSEAWDTIFMHGELYECTVSITIEEYH